jgi:maleylpyruvate isomerase
MLVRPDAELGVPARLYGADVHSTVAEQGLLPSLAVATDELLARLRALHDRDLRAPSLLPGWSRGHVVAHVALVGDALSRLLLSARTGEDIPAYASQNARDDEIALWAGRGASALAAEPARTARHFDAQVSAMPAHAWTAKVSVLGGLPFPAAQVIVRRLSEVVLHHTDLGLGYDPEHWPAKFVIADLPEPMRDQRLARQRGLPAG